MDLNEFKGLRGKALRRKLSKLTDEEKLALADAVIDRDAAFWKRYIRNDPYAIGYYLSHIDGLALTERQR